MGVDVNQLKGQMVTHFESTVASKNIAFLLLQFLTTLVDAEQDEKVNLL